MSGTAEYYSVSKKLTRVGLWGGFLYRQSLSDIGESGAPATETAAKEKADAVQFKEKYDEKLKNVDKESEEILSETRKKALKKETAIVGEAKEEANRILERANREVELEKNKVKDEVKQEMISVAAAMAGKVIEVSLDEGKQSQLIEDTLKEMGDETWLS